MRQVVAVCMFVLCAAVAGAAPEAKSKKNPATKAAAKAKSDEATKALLKQEQASRAKPASENAVAKKTVAAPVHGETAGGGMQSLGAVRPSNLVLPQLAISSFTGGSHAGGIAQVIQNDLALADVTARAANSSAVSAAQAQDAAAGQVNLDGWVSAGVHYVLRGSLSGGSAQAELFDIASKQRLFGKTYSGFSDADYRRLAHKVADDVMSALTNGAPGIFSSQILFLADRGRTKEIMVADPDGQNVRQLTNENALVASACWGKSGTEIYYTSYRDNNPDLYGITLNGSRFDVSKRPGLNTAPCWNESIQRLAVSLSKDGNSEVYTMSRDGRDMARATNTTDADTAPSWSPNGAQIAFTSDRSGTPQIYMMSASGGGAQRITGGNGYFDSPAWSPDGKKLAYVAREEGGFNIYVADLGGGPAIQLTRGQRDNTDPTWGADSKHLIFSSNRSGGKELYMISTDTKVAHQLTKDASAISPDWGPLR